MENEEKEIEEVSVAEDTMRMCKILYCQKDLPMTKTCMCWGWECGEGWHEILRRLSCELEALNLLYYDKYKVRIQADQVKEKFGTLRFYYSVVCDNYTEAGLAANKVIEAFEKKLDSNYFGRKDICDKEAFYSEEKDDNGKTVKVWHPAKYHSEMTLHLDEYEAMKKEADEARKTLYDVGFADITPEQEIVISFLETEADRRVKQAETDCYNTCEQCGSTIGTDWSPRCETAGWITYICSRCASKVDKAGREQTYFKNGEKWKGNIRLMTKAEVDAAREEAERKLREKYKDFDDEDDDAEDAEKIQEKFNNEISEAMNENKK